MCLIFKKSKNNDSFFSGWLLPLNDVHIQGSKLSLVSIIHNYLPSLSNQNDGLFRSLCSIEIESPIHTLFICVCIAIQSTWLKSFCLQKDFCKTFVKLSIQNVQNSVHFSTFHIEQQTGRRYLSLTVMIILTVLRSRLNIVNK